MRSTKLRIVIYISIVSFRRSEAKGWLYIDDELVGYGSTFPDFTQLSENSILYLGRLPESLTSVSPLLPDGGFTGCIRRLKVDSRLIDLISAATSARNVGHCQIALCSAVGATYCLNGAMCLPSGNELGAFSCSCAVGYTGQRCESPYDPCLSGTRCRNGGTCTTPIDGNRFNCDCPYGFSGTACEKGRIRMRSIRRSVILIFQMFVL